MFLFVQFVVQIVQVSLQMGFFQIVESSFFYQSAVAEAFRHDQLSAFSFDFIAEFSDLRSQAEVFTHIVSSFSFDLLSAQILRDGQFQILFLFSFRQLMFVDFSISPVFTGFSSGGGQLRKAHSDVGLGVTQFVVFLYEHSAQAIVLVVLDVPFSFMSSSHLLDSASVAFLVGN